MPKKKEIQKRVEDFAFRTKNVIGAGLVTPRGYLLGASVSKSEIPEEQFGSIVSTAVDLCRRNIQAFSSGSFAHAFVKAEKGYLAVIEVPETEGNLLVVITNQDVDINQTLESMRQSAKEFSKLMVGACDESSSWT